MTERFDRFEEGLAVLESLLTNDRTTFEGRYYTLTEAMNNPKPVQSPLPVCIGGQGKKRTLPLAARFAHHWNYSGTDPEGFAGCQNVLHESCAAIGRDPGEITSSTILRWSGDGAAFRAEVEAMSAVGAEMVAKAPMPASAHFCTSSKLQRLDIKTNPSRKFTFDFASAPINLSSALCRPTSSRDSRIVPSAEHQAAACTVRFTAFIGCHCGSAS